MIPSTISLLRCPVCGDELTASKIRRTKQAQIGSCTLTCPSDHHFPVVMERPILLPTGAISKWVAPIDEAIGNSAGTVPPLSLPRLAKIGVEKAISMFKKQEAKRQEAREIAHDNDYSAIVTPALLSKARYRKSGQWFRSKRRAEGMLEGSKLPASDKSDSAKAVRRFRDTVVRLKPKRLIDLASGGGNGVSCIMHKLRGAEKVMAVERDIRCTWTIQYRLEYLGGADIADVIAADVRILPVQSESFDAATTMQALTEICGIRRFLAEVHRILEPGGHYVAFYGCEPALYDTISLDEFRRFALEADLYAGHKEFIGTANKAGFDHVDTAFAECSTRTQCVSTFRKR